MNQSPAGQPFVKSKLSDGVFAVAILTAVTLACLCPFLGKAFHIDDPLFIWSAKHIVSEPGNFYHFNVNWYGKTQSMSEATQNPPLAAYYLALVGLMLGWSELALHAGFLVPALAVVLGTCRLARRFCAHPLAAGLATVTAPVFLVSGTSVMCDTMMLALWVWALVFWTEGLETNGPLKLGTAALLMAATGLTKYFGFALVPLALVYALMERRKFGAWLGYLLVPVVILAAYEWLTQKLYGRGALADAFSYSQNQGGDALPMKILVGLAFSGGSIIVLLPAAPFLWRKRWVALGCAATILFGLYLARHKRMDHFSTWDGNQPNWLFVIQAALMVAAGVVLFILATADLLRNKTSAATLLFLWVTGTFAFTCVACWQVGGRYLLPMVPAAAILLVRRLEFRKLLDDRKLVGPLWGPLGISVVIALLVAWADYDLADSSRLAAGRIKKELGPSAHALWFEGHWGFQYYMQQQGAKPVDFWHMPFVTSDVIVLPQGNSNVYPPPKVDLVNSIDYTCGTSKWLTTMSLDEGAGFYSSDFGPLPYVFCSVPPGRYQILRVP